MFRNLCKTLFLVLLSAAVLSSSYAGPKLRYQMSKWAKYKYTIKDETTSRFTKNRKRIDTKLVSYFAISFVVENTSAESLTLISQVDSNLTRIRSTGEQGNVTVMKELNGKRVRLSLTPLGKVTKSVAIDSVTPSPVEVIGGVAELLRELFTKLPERPVGIGDKWNYNSVDTANAKGMTVISKPDIQFTVIAEEEMNRYNCLKILLEGTTSVYSKDVRGGLEMVLNGKTTSRGLAWFAPKEGLLVYVSSGGTNVMTFSGPGAPLESTQEYESSQTMTLTK